MKIKISLRPEKYKEIEAELMQMGVENDDQAELELIERQIEENFLAVKDQQGDRHEIKIDEIVFMESFGRRIDIHTKKQVFYSSVRLYQLEEMLVGKGFLRVSNSVIIARKEIQKIRPTISTKFVLTMSEGSLVDVTRGYYYIFRNEMNI